MKGKAIRVLRNVKLLVPLLLLLFGVIAIFDAIGCAVCVFIGRADKIPGVILIALFVMGLCVYTFWPLISYKNEW